MNEPRKDRVTPRELAMLKVLASTPAGAVYGGSLATGMTQEGFPGTSFQSAHQTAASLVRKGFAVRESIGFVGYRITHAGQAMLARHRQAQRPVSLLSKLFPIG